MSRIVLAVGFCLTFIPSVSAQTKDPAELFPASTIAYVELRDPAAVADSIAALVKGTSLENGLKLLHDRRDANKDPRLFLGQPGLSFAVTITSPEFLAEVRKLRGVAVGFTGQTKSHEPKVVLAIMLGESTAASLLARVYLTNEATFRRVDTIDGVAVFQSRAAATVTYDPNTGQPIVPEPKKAAEGPLEATYAYTPGLFLIATNKDAIADVLSRWKGEGDSLAKQADFEADAAVRKPGLNVFVRPHAFLQAADAAKKAQKDWLDPASASLLKLVVNVRAIPSISGHFAIAPDGLRATLHVRRDAKQVSPLLDFLTGTVSADIQPMLTNLAAAWTVALPPAANRLAATLRLADAIAKSHGEVGPLPSEWVADAERKTKLAIREKLIGSVEAVTMLVPPKQELPSNVEPLPLLALHCTTEKLAAEWLDAMPKLAACFAETDIALSPTTETVAGVKVFTVRVRTTPIHYARAGANVVLGLDRKWVAGSLAANLAGRKSEPPAADTSAYAVGVPLGLVLFDRWSVWYPELKSTGPALYFNGNGLGGVTTADPPAWFSDKELITAFGPLPPLVARTTKSANGLTAELRFDFDAGGAKPILERLIPVIEKLGTRNLTPYYGGFLLDR